MIYYLPLEHLEMRYTTHLDRDVRKYLIDNNIEHYIIEPEKTDKISVGSFLDTGTTIMSKSKQIYHIAELYRQGKIKDEDVIFTTDLWFTGIESIAYLNYFYNKKTKLKGIIHAGSFTDTDFVRDMERWAKLFEDMIFDISDNIFVASDFIANDIYKKRLISRNKIIVTGLPLDLLELDKYKNNNEKEDIVIFNGRNVDEKQPWLFEELKNKFKNVKFINTQKENLSKRDYYKLLSKSKAVVSFALQENFGYGIQEAVYLGCIPIVPNRLVYKEQFDIEYRYNNFEDCINKMSLVFENKLKTPQIQFNDNNDIFKKWFN